MNWCIWNLNILHKHPPTWLTFWITGECDSTSWSISKSILITYMNSSPNSLNIQLHEQFHLISCLFGNTHIVCVWTSNTTYMQKEMPINRPEHTKTLQYICPNGDILSCLPWIQLLTSMFFVVTTLKILKYVIFYNKIVTKKEEQNKIAG